MSLESGPAIALIVLSTHTGALPFPSNELRIKSTSSFWNNMNKKKLNILLIPLALILWIVIVLKIVSLTRPQQVDSYIIKPEYNQISPDDTVDTLKLLLNYSDPFSSNRNTQLKPVTKVTGNKNSSVKFFEKKPESPMPSVSYLGTISSGKNSKNSALLVVNGKSVLLSPNDTITGIKVLQCWTDSIILKYDKRTLVVKRR